MARPIHPAHLVGTAEIAERLHVQPATINQWRRRHPDFPKPVTVLRMGAIWDWRAVAAWAERTNRLGVDTF